MFALRSRRAIGSVFRTNLQVSFHSPAQTQQHNQYGWNPVTNPIPAGFPHLNQRSMQWDPFEPVDKWLGTVDLDTIQTDFLQKGFAVVENIIPTSHMESYLSIHDMIQNGELHAPGRHDLGAHKEQVRKGKENVGQVMWPSDLIEHSRDGPLHQRAFAISQILLGDDTVFDFDMLIYKEANSMTETPWHQDEAYWPSGMTDKRAITVWTALDEASLDNGAMWFITGSHKEPTIRKHRNASEGSHILMTDDVSETEPGAVVVPLKAGSAVLWHGRTCHYSRGNITNHKRRTFITNFRPESMVIWEREHGFDHLRKGMDDYACQMESGGDVNKGLAKDVRIKTTLS